MSVALNPVLRQSTTSILIHLADAFFQSNLPYSTHKERPTHEEVGYPACGAHAPGVSVSAEVLDTEVEFDLIARIVCLLVSCFTSGAVVIDLDWGLVALVSIGQS